MSVGLSIGFASTNPESVAEDAEVGAAVAVPVRDERPIARVAAEAGDGDRYRRAGDVGVADAGAVDDPEGGAAAEDVGEDGTSPGSPPKVSTRSATPSRRVLVYHTPFR